MDILIKLQLKTFMIFILFSQTVLGQNDSTKISLLKWDPLAIYNPYTVAIQFGFEKPTSNKHSFQYTLGYILAVENRSDYRVNGRGVKSKFQSRWYKDSVLEGKYISIEIFYNYFSYLREGTFQGTVLGCHEVYRINKWTTGLNFKWGHQKIKKRIITGDFYWGLGIKFREVWYTEKECPTNLLSWGHCFTCGKHIKGFTVLPNLSLGYNFGIKIKRESFN